MESKHESAKLILRLYNLRRETAMRAARDWFFMFNPTSADEMRTAILGPDGAKFRMVVSYWDMAASLVNNGAIDEQMFNDANTEHIVTFAKIHPYLAEFREKANAPAYLKHFEQLIMRLPDAEERLERSRALIRALAEARAKAAEA